MKALLGCLCMSAALILAACEGWPSPNISYVPGTVLPTHTPIIRTPTPIVVSPAPSTLPTLLITLTPLSATPSPTETSSATPSPAAATATLTPVPVASVSAKVLGCDTSLDITHGMGEVTNAYVTVSNAGTGDAADVCATLSGLDEGRPHPDKTKCVPSLPHGYEITWKLTVDTTYEKNTPIQVDVTSGQKLLTRVGEAACKQIDLLIPSLANLGILQPIP